MPELPLVGDEFAGYRVRSVLGRGGMSVVYQAENVRLSSVIALKVLAPELAADDTFRARFLEESRIAASLNHPNVIPTGPPPGSQAGVTADRYSWSSPASQSHAGDPVSPAGAGGVAAVLPSGPGQPGGTLTSHRREPGLAGPGEPGQPAGAQPPPGRSRGRSQ